MNPMRTYTIVVEPEDGGGYFVTVPALPGCFTRGSTIDECRERAVEAIEVHIAGLQADGEPVPNEVGAPQLLAVTLAASSQAVPGCQAAHGLKQLSRLAWIHDAAAVHLSGHF